jgi:small nuclear ribonucleoprotein (snRNP)-like protein
MMFFEMQLVELKNGETYNGHLVNCDTWMNIHLREVICTSKDGDRFWRMPECYIRGNTIKYLRVPDEVIDKVKEETVKRSGKPTFPFYPPVKTQCVILDFHLLVGIANCWLYCFLMRTKNLVYLKSHVV